MENGNSQTTYRELVSSDYLQQALATNQQKYIKKLNALIESVKIENATLADARAKKHIWTVVSWNWAAAIGGSLWMAYRGAKYWQWAVAAICLALITGSLGEISLGVIIFLGLFGNTLVLVALRDNYLAHREPEKSNPSELRLVVAFLIQLGFLFYPLAKPY